MPRITKGRRSKKPRPSHPRRKAFRAPKAHGNEGQGCDTPGQLEGPLPQSEADEYPACEAMNQHMDNGTETAEQHATLRATNSQDNAPAAENDTSDAKEEHHAQPPTTSPFDGAELGHDQDPQLLSLQFIVNHRLMGERYDLRCILATGAPVWLSEADVQEVWSPAVCTYWNCKDGFERPKDVVPPAVLRVLDRCPEKPGHLQVQMVGDPIFSGTNREKEQFFEHDWIQNPTCKLIFNYKSVNLPETELITHWPKPYQKWRHELSAPEDGIQFIHGHRKLQTDSTAFFSFSILSKDRTNGTFESWVDERDLHLKHGSAVLTYWRSLRGVRAREAKKDPKVPNRFLQIHSHYRRNGVLYLRIQYVGKSALEGDLGRMSAARLMREWANETKDYLAEHNLGV